MGRPRKQLTGNNSSDPQTLANDVVQETLAVLRENGIAVPLNVTLSVYQAVQNLLPIVPNGSNNKIPTTTNNTITEVTHG